MEINKIKQLLERQGFQPNIDKDGDMLFKFEGGDYYITIDKRDTNFIAIICPFFQKIREEERIKAISCAQEVTQKIKVAKVFVAKDLLFGTVEMFLLNEDFFSGNVWIRCLRAIQASKTLFSSLMRSEKTENRE